MRVIGSERGRSNVKTGDKGQIDGKAVRANPNPATRGARARSERKPRTPPTDASQAAGRIGGGRRPAAHAAAAGPASVRAARQPEPPWTVPVGAVLETPAASNLRAPTRPMARRPGGERKDALDTAVASRRRCRAQVASVAAAASAASLGVKPQAEAPHSAPDAPRGALRRRLRRRTTSSARARTQRHRLVAARARAGPTWESERSSSVTRARQGARRKGRARRSKASGSLGAAPSSDAPGAGRSKGEAAQIFGRTN